MTADECVPILSVEDEPILAMDLSDSLDGAGYLVSCAVRLFCGLGSFIVSYKIRHQTNQAIQQPFPAA